MMHKLMGRTWMVVLVSGALAMGATAQMVEASSPTPPTPGQVNDPLLAGTEQFAKGAKEVTEVNMDGKSLGMMGSTSGLGDTAKKLDFVVVHTYGYEHAGMYRQADVDTVVNRLHDGSWSCLVHTRSATETADICMRQAADHETNEMVVITSEPRELTFIHLKGRATLEDLQKLGANVGALPPPAPTPPLAKR